MYHYVYRITNILAGKHYYGKRSSKIEPKLDIGVKYFSSSSDSNFMKDQKESPKHYKYKVVKTFESSSDAISFEIRLHNYFDVGKNPRFYNKAKQTSVGCDSSGIVRTMSPELRALMSKVHKGKTIPEEQKAKISNALKGRPSPNKGKVASEYTRKLLSEKTKGINNPNYGVKASPEKLKKMSEAVLGAKHPQAKKANIYDYKTKQLIAESVVIKEWCRYNNYCPSSLSKTARADLGKPHNGKLNVHRHKGIYARYV